MKKIVWKSHPYLFTLVSLLFIYLVGSWSFPPTQVIRSLLFLWAVLFIIRPIANKLGGDENWGSILLTIFVFGLFFQEVFYKLIGVMVVIIILLFIIFIHLLKQKINIIKVSGLLTITSLIILTIQVVALARDLKPIPISYFKSIAKRIIKAPTVTLSTPQNGLKPDIYYIVLDSYPRADILKELFHYDNSNFIDYLEKVGFVVPENAHSNYPRTALSISSTLDMQYINDILPNTQGLKFWWLAEPVIDHSRVRASLESIGYQSVSIASNWGITNNESTNLYFKPYPIILSDYENFFILSTPIKSLYTPFQRIAPIPSNPTHRRYILFNFDTLEKIPNINGPKFVVAHIIAPHPPFVLLADGSSVESSVAFTLETAGSLSVEEQKEGYINEIEFLNKKLRITIEKILNDSETPPIIILQADHGSGLYLNFYSQEDSCMKERFSIFGAYYLPGKSTEAIPQNITPVNLFRIIFNEYFDADMGLLENHMYFSNGNSMFDLDEVTDQIDNVCLNFSVIDRRE
jgi:hypothetical protein